MGASPHGEGVGLWEKANKGTTANSQKRKQQPTTKTQTQKPNNIIYNLINYQHTYIPTYLLSHSSLSSPCLLLSASSLPCLLALPSLPALPCPPALPALLLSLPCSLLPAHRSRLTTRPPLPFRPSPTHA